MANFCTGIKECGVPIEDKYLLKEKLLENYPDLVPQFKSSSLWGWGFNYIRGDQNPAYYCKASPSQTIAGGNNWKQASVANYSAGAIKSDGTLWMWGYNGNGRLGSNSTTANPVCSPIQTVSGGTNWKLISMGGQLSGAIKTDGTLWLWGSNGAGQLGNNNTITNSSPVQTISGGTDWKTVDHGGFYRTITIALKNDGSLWTWGCGANWWHGNHNTINQSSPVQTIAGGTNWCFIATQYFASGAIKTDGTLWTWGRNVAGTLGTNDVTPRSSPVQTISSTSDWKSASFGGASSAGIKTDGSLWLWGEWRFAIPTELSVNNIRLSSPTQVVNSGNNWKKICVYSNSAVGMKTDGTLWGWGDNTEKVLGYGDFSVNIVAPTRIFPNQTNIKNFSWERKGGLFIKEEGDM